MCAYANTTNKALIRREWDLPILTAWKELVGHDLSYFGLPGPEIHDFQDWSSVLDKRRTGVEEKGRTKKEMEAASEVAAVLRLNVDVTGLSSGFELLRGRIEDIILEGSDVYGTVPQQHVGAGHSCRFTYDLINLDFNSGFGYPNQFGAAHRMSAIRKLFERQRGTSFVLLLTISRRDQVGDEIQRFLSGLQTRDRGQGWRELVEWYKQRGDGERAHKLKAAIPSFIHAMAETNMFRAKCYPPLAYQGHHANMVHFAFELESRQGNFREFSDQDDPDLLALPLVEVIGGQLEFAKLQYPGFDVDACMPTLDFLSEETTREMKERFLRGVEIDAVSQRRRGKGKTSQSKQTMGPYISSQDTLLPTDASASGSSFRDASAIGMTGEPSSG